MRIFYLIVISLFIQTSIAQKKDLKKIVKTLSSKKFYGRSATNDGDRLAAQYIKNFFVKNNVQQYGRSYFQYFNYNINTFPNQLSLKINNQIYKPGHDFIVAAGCPNLNLIDKIQCVDEKDILQSQEITKTLKRTSHKALFIKKSKTDSFNKYEKNKIRDFLKILENNNHRFNIILIESEKLTASLSAVVSKTAVVYIKSNFDVKTDNPIEVHIDQELKTNHKSQNVIGWVPGKLSDAKTFVFTAHYDHIGTMGRETYFPGANDNASGTALLLKLASHYSKPKNKPNHNILFIAFGGEEIGLIGSKYFVSNPTINLENIQWVYNLDIAGTGSQGIKVIHNQKATNIFKTLKQINNNHMIFKDIYKRNFSCNSDHCAFNFVDIPVLYGYTLGGSKAYHDINDKASNLEFRNMEKYFKLLNIFIERLDKI